MAKKSGAPKKTYSFTTGDLTASFASPAVTGLVSAKPGARWLSTKRGASFPVGSVPASLNGSVLIQKSNRLWIRSLEFSRAVSLYVAVRKNWLKDEKKMDDKLKSIKGWSVVDEAFTTDGVGKGWKWALITTNLAAGAHSIPRPFRMKNVQVVFFIK